MMVTKQEVEKVKDEEIKELKTRLEASDIQIQNCDKQYEVMKEMEAKIREQETVISKMKADKEVIDSKMERIDLENKRLKEELELS